MIVSLIENTFFRVEMVFQILLLNTRDEGLHRDEVRLYEMLTKLNQNAILILVSGCREAEWQDEQEGGG